MIKNSPILAVIVILLFAGGVYLITKNFEPKPKDNNIDDLLIDENLAEPYVITLKEGEGDLISKNGDVLFVDYIGYFKDGTVFDSSIQNEEPFAFVLGGGQVIAGWDVSLVGMKIGEIRRILVPASYGYGDTPVGPIPANSLLVFDIELLEIRSQETAVDEVLPEEQI